MKQEAVSEKEEELKIGDVLEITKRYTEDEVIKVKITIDEFIADNFKNSMMYTIYLLHKRIKDLEEIETYLKRAFPIIEKASKLKTIPNSRMSKIFKAFKGISTVNLNKSIIQDNLTHDPETLELFLEWAKEELALEKDKESLNKLLCSRRHYPGVIYAPGIGIFPGGHASIKKLIAFVEKNNKSLKDLINANILTSKNSTVYSKYEDRVLLPFTEVDTAKNTSRKGFVALTYKKEDERTGALNYLDNSRKINEFKWNKN